MIIFKNILNTLLCEICNLYRKQWFHAGSSFQSKKQIDKVGFSGPSKVYLIKTSTGG